MYLKVIEFRGLGGVKKLEVFEMYITLYVHVFVAIQINISL